VSFPLFFEDLPRITLRDPLARFLGAADGGILEYTYADAVKLAGHSCPTVASAYLMTRNALRSLYPDPADLPERGGIRVELHEDLLDGVTGVVANVLSLLTGATHESGFKGIGGRFDRRGLMSYGVELPGQVRFSRTDTGASVTVSTRLERIALDPRIPPLMPRCLHGEATAEEELLFRSLWQTRVQTLTEHADDPEIFVVHH